MQGLHSFARAIFMPQSYAAEIAQLEKLINSATKGVSADGIRTDFDLDAARKRLGELRQLADPSSNRVRPRVFRADISGAW